jgi:succinate-semialdehyde dehydrogenase / glutarate-semialdehyde dehydrogenase
MKAVEKVEAHIADAIKRGAKVTVGGRHWALGGTFFETTNMVITKEETFGTGGAALPLQDRRRGGQDGQRHRVRARCLFAYSKAATSAASDTWPKASNTPTLPSPARGGGLGRGINEGIISTEIAPLGGMKDSSIGRDGSKYGIDEFLEVKYLCMGGIDR